MLLLYCLGGQCYSRGWGAVWVQTLIPSLQTRALCGMSSKGRRQVCVLTAFLHPWSDSSDESPTRTNTDETALWAIAYQKLSRYIGTTSHSSRPVGTASSYRHMPHVQRQFLLHMMSSTVDHLIYPYVNAHAHCQENTVTPPSHNVRLVHPSAGRPNLMLISMSSSPSYTPSAPCHYAC